MNGNWYKVLGKSKECQGNVSGCKVPRESGMQAMPGDRMGVGAKCQGNADKCRECQENVMEWVQMPGECRGMPGERMGVGAKYQGNAGKCRGMPRQRMGERAMGVHAK